MKTFLKVLLILVAVLLALKLLPVIFGLAVGLFACVMIAAAVGLGVVGVVICVALGILGFLAPLWLPVLAIVGLIALWKRVARAA